MVGEGRLVDALVVEGLADEVDDRLHDERRQDQQRHQREEQRGKADPAQDSMAPSVYHQLAEGDLDGEEGDVEEEEDAAGHPRLPLDQRLALLHRRQPVGVFQHRDDAGQVPHHADVNQAGDVGGDEDDQGGDAASVGADKEEGEDQDEDGEGVVGEEDGEVPEEGDQEAAPYLGDDGEDLAEGHVLGGVDAGDGVDDSGGGEEGEDEDDEEVGGLEGRVGGPLGGEAVEDFDLGAAAGGGVLERVLIPVDLGEDELGDLDVEEEDEGERNHEPQGDAGEDLPPRYQYLLGLPEDAHNPQELQLLRLRIHAPLNPIRLCVPLLAPGSPKEETEEEDEEERKGQGRARRHWFIFYEPRD